MELRARGVREDQPMAVLAAVLAAVLVLPIASAAPLVLQNHSVHEAWVAGQAVTGMRGARLYRAQTRELGDLTRHAMFAVDNDLQTCGELHVTLGFPISAPELASLASIDATFRGQVRIDYGQWLGFTGSLHLIEGLADQYFDVEHWAADAASQLIRQASGAELLEVRLFMSHSFSPQFTFPMMGFTSAVNTMVSNCHGDRERSKDDRFDEAGGFLSPAEQVELRRTFSLD